MLSKKQLQHVCLQGCGAQECRYLMYSTNGNNMVCSKQLTKEQQARDKIVNTFIADCKKKGLQPNSVWPINMGNYVGLGNGNNCKGYPILPNTQQGYDIDLGITNKKQNSIKGKP